MKRQRGAVLLLVMTLAVIGLSMVAVSLLSVNQRKTQSIERTFLSMDTARNTLLGYSLTQSIPGSLPCPDTDGDGFENRVGSTCSALKGLYPFRTLGSGELKDSTGNRLWYVIDAVVAPDSPALNSSQTPQLRVSGSLAVAAVIAPGMAENGQSRTNATTANQYLEGTNASSNVTISQQGNDQVLALSQVAHWQLIERRVLTIVSELLSLYQTQCGVLPWAADFSQTSANSTINLTLGHPPINQALPDNWNTNCAVGITPPSWLLTHWQNELLYHMCEPADGNCIAITNGNPSSAEYRVLAPGVALSGQTRPSTQINDYYELENADGDRRYEYTVPAEKTGSINDTLYQ